MKKRLIVLLAVALLGVAVGGYALTRGGSNTAAVKSEDQITLQNITQDRSTAANNYPDGAYTSDVAETLYGDVQISIVIKDGQISDVQYLKMPDIEDGRSRQLTEMSKPLLKATTLAKQSDQIDFVTGATSTSFGYQESLQSALDKAYRASQDKT